MKLLATYIVKKFIPDWENIGDQQVRSRYGTLEGWTSVISNIVFTILKAILGLITGSVSLIADAFHSFSDVSTSIVIIITYRLSNKPPDQRHPYGHGRMEAIGTVIVSFILLLISFELLKTGIDHIIHPREISVSWLVVIIMGISIIFKEIQAQFALELGSMIDSDSIKADAWHHRTDALSSIAVVIALLLQKFNIFFGDGLAAIIISILIGYTGVEFLIKGVDELLGKCAPDHMVRKVKKAVGNFPQVLGMHDLIIHRYGQNIIGSLHLELSNQLSLGEAHTIADEVERRLKIQFDMHITVHIDPVDIQDPLLKKVRSYLQKYSDGKQNFNFHDLRIKHKKGKKILVMDLIVTSQIEEKETNVLRSEIKEQIKEKFSEIDRVNCEIDPEFML